MTDRELLELAAKAAGYQGAEYEWGEWMEIRYGLKEALWVEDIESYWNPLVDDGQALRLAVKLDLFRKALGSPKPGISHEDACAAARRAIVRAAADIGREMT
jgi:hypothetical protein